MEDGQRACELVELDGRLARELDRGIHRIGIEVRAGEFQSSAERRDFESARAASEPGQIFGQEFPQARKRQVARASQRVPVQFIEAPVTAHRGVEADLAAKHRRQVCGDGDPGHSIDALECQVDVAQLQQRQRRVPALDGDEAPANCQKTGRQIVESHRLQGCVPAPQLDLGSQREFARARCA